MTVQGAGAGRTAGTVRRAGTVLELLSGWVEQQRWFAAKGVGATTLVEIGTLELAGRAASAGPGSSSVRVILLRAETGGIAVVYQVPVTVHPAARPDLEQALVGVADAGPAGERWVYDGPHDPVFVDAYLELLAGGAATGDAATGDGADTGGLSARGVLARPRAPRSGPSSVLRGEQSNTSVIVGADGPDPMMVKVFRVLAAGPNPDVVVQTALAAAGSDRVPAPIGWIEGSWPAAQAAAGDQPAAGHLAYACEFLPGSQDAWREACRAVEHGEPFTEQARGLGAATARVHTALATALPTRATTPAALQALADGLLARVTWAGEAAPVLAPYADRARELIEAVRHLPDPPACQQVHGDYHLGQVLHSPTRGWVLLDFEGEPLRPLAQRLEPDLALRDVAGMLRSFDYAAARTTADAAAGDPRVAAATAWVLACREAFLDGYAAAGADDPRDRPQLLVALELDKALYEVVYETRNRPAWISVPLGAVRRLLG